MPRLVNPFKTLGLQPATVKDLGLEGALDLAKVMYRQLSSVHHPDKGGKPAKFDAINEAYRLLSGSSDAAEFYEEFISTQAARREVTLAELRLEHQENLIAWRRALGQALLAPNVPGSVSSPNPGLRVLVRAGSALQELTFDEDGAIQAEALTYGDEQTIPALVEGGVGPVYHSDGEYLRRCTPKFGKEDQEEEGHLVQTELPEGWYRFGPHFKDGTGRQLMRALESVGTPRPLFKRPLVLVNGAAGEYSRTKTSQLALEPGGGVSASLDNIEISDMLGNPDLLSLEWQYGAVLLTVARDLQVGVHGEIIGLLSPD